MSIQNNSTITKGLIGLCVLLALALVYVSGPQLGLPFGPHQASVPASVSKAKAKELALAYINDKILQGQATAEIPGDVSEEKGLYKFEVSVAGQSLTSYMTKDGSLLFPTGYSLTKTEASAGSHNTSPKVTKAERPDVKLFVMSYCPYGVQAIKGFLPVYNLLKDKADMGIYYVDYSMHGKKEIDENLVQYCIQKEQRDKFSPYLACFTETQDDQKCQVKAGVDTKMLKACIAATDKQFGITKDYNDKSTWANGQFPRFAIDKDLNDKYGVQGSPTLVVNGKKISSGRSPAAFLKTICAAFINPPEECKQELSSETPSPGFGGGTGSDSNGNCE